MDLLDRGEAPTRREVLEVAVGSENAAKRIRRSFDFRNLHSADHQDFTHQTAPAMALECQSIRNLVQQQRVWPQAVTSGKSLGGRKQIMTHVPAWGKRALTPACGQGRHDPLHKRA